MLRLKIEMVRNESDTEMILRNNKIDQSQVLINFEKAKLMMESYNIISKPTSLDFYQMCGFTSKVNSIDDELMQPVKEFVAKMKDDFDKIYYLIETNEKFTYNLGTQIQNLVSRVNTQYEQFLSVYSKSLEQNIKKQINEIIVKNPIKFNCLNDLAETLKTLSNEVSAPTQLLIQDFYSKIFKFKNGRITNPGIIRVEINFIKKEIDMSVCSGESLFSDDFFDLLTESKLNEYSCVAGVMDSCLIEFDENKATIEDMIQSINNLSFEMYDIGPMTPEIAKVFVNSKLSFEE